MSHLDTPSSGIKFKRPVGINVHIRSDEDIPGTVAFPEEKEFYVQAGESGLDRSGLVPDGAVTFDLLGLLQLGNDVRCGDVAQSGFILGLAHLNHPDDVALEVTAVNEPEELRTREPAVNQQIIKPQALHYTSPEHLYGIGDFRLKHLLLAGVHLLVLSAFPAVLCGSLLSGEPLFVYFCPWLKGATIVCFVIAI